jgi:thiamine-phosphate pyrophosphorylase
MTRDERRAKAHGIYAIVDEGTGDPLAIADGALAGGVRILQYRAKSGIVPARLYALRERTRAYGALLIVNDDPHAAVAYDCDGVHLGPGDDGFDDPDRVRAALGERLIGLSCGTEDEARWANAFDVDYVGVGPVFATASKADAGEPIGLEGLRRIAAITRHAVCAIGGITRERLRAVRETGVAMAAVISALRDAGDPALAAEWLVRIWRDEDTR